MERREERSRPRQVALGLCNTRFVRESIEVVWYDIENLIKFSRRFGETTKVGVEKKGVMAEQGNIARIERLGLVEIAFAVVPLSLSPGEIGQQFRNLAAIGQELTCLLEVKHRSVVIL